MMWLMLALCSGFLGVVIGSLRGHTLGTSFFLGLILGPIGWAMLLFGKSQDAKKPPQPEG